MNILFPPVKKSASLEVAGISLSRGDRSLISGLSITINQGDVLWTQGNNGIGKTTFLEALAGLRRPDTGRVSWMEGSTPVRPEKLIAYQPHKSFAKALLTTKEDLKFWAGLYGTMSLVTEALDYVGLSEQADITTQNLSAGQRRRLALAKLIISQKPIWIMDEPGAAMDNSGVQLIDRLIAQHIERGGIAIIASHDTSRKLSTQTRRLTLEVAA
ncbi:heme ABC exporter ATP-binding protein CcmA [Hellea sp.]|nr:heme ABC exporter ATP-binding protein CcmA [Hellea sp.]